MAEKTVVGIDVDASDREAIRRYGFYLDNIERALAQAARSGAVEFVASGFEWEMVYGELCYTVNQQKCSAGEVPTLVALCEKIGQAITPYQLEQAERFRRG